MKGYLRWGSSHSKLFFLITPLEYETNEGQGTVYVAFVYFMYVLIFYCIMDCSVEICTRVHRIKMWGDYKTIQGPSRRDYTSSYFT